VNSQIPQELLDFNITIWQVLLVNEAKEAGLEKNSWCRLAPAL